VLFEIVEGEPQSAEPDERTREYATRPPDEEDTLHPEDGVLPPPPSDAPAPMDTMVVPAGTIGVPGERPAPETPQAGLGRRLLALLVIAALTAIIVALVWWGLAR
jgi:hypothetical protein